MEMVEKDSAFFSEMAEAIGFGTQPEDIMSAATGEGDDIIVIYTTNTRSKHPLAHGAILKRDHMGELVIYSDKELPNFFRDLNRHMDVK